METKNKKFDELLDFKLIAKDCTRYLIKAKYRYIQASYSIDDGIVEFVTFYGFNELHHKGRKIGAKHITIIKGGENEN